MRWFQICIKSPSFLSIWPFLVKNRGQNRRIRVKSGGLVEIYLIYICFDSKFSQEFRFNIFQGQSGSSEVKLGSNPFNRGQIGPVGRNISNIHMFRLKILSEIKIQNYLRSNLVIKSHQRSNWSKKRLIGLFGQIVYNIHMFDSEFSRETKWIDSELAKSIVNFKWVCSEIVLDSEIVNL